MPLTSLLCTDGKMADVALQMANAMQIRCHVRSGVATNLNKGPGLIECRPVFDTVSKGPEADVGILSKVSHRVLTQPATVLVVQCLQMTDTNLPAYASGMRIGG